ncbi:MAG: 4-demethylwyosine synthase TYW1 [Candidatus Woesearchaeota archaeon]
MISDLRKKELENQGYRVVGRHSAIKVCTWCKKAIRGQDTCYKHLFYGINSWRCIQMSPWFACTHRCVFCWRDVRENLTPDKIDEPKDIVDGCIDAHTDILKGFGGNKERDKKRYEESLKPLHFAISLTGEPCIYPKLPELVDEIKSRGMTAFLVTNGTVPEMLKKLIKHQPTQLYITLPAPDEETYLKTCNPLVEGTWKKIQESLLLIKDFKRSTIRLTLVKGINMVNPEGYAELIKQAGPTFVELKAYMFVGHSRERLTIENMPLHSDILDFAEKIAKASGLKIISQKPESRVVLLIKKDSKDRILVF